MIGIKTMVKTDWKNYAHGNTKEWVIYGGTKNRIYTSDWYATGLKKGDVVWLSYHAEWKGLIKNAFRKEWIFQFDDVYDYEGCGFVITSSEGEADVSKKITISTHFGGKKDVIESDIAHIFMHGEDLGGTVDEGGYMKLTNIMLSKDKPMPYIDSDELKASGGGNS